MKIFLQPFLNAGLSAALLASLIACGGDRANDEVVVTEDRLDTTLQQSVDNQIIPTALAFQTQAQELVDNVDIFCQLPGEAGLTNLQQKWRELSVAWYRLSIYQFGPVNDDIVFPKYIFIDSLRLRGTDYKETVRVEISQTLTSNEALDEAHFDGLTFQKVGLLALESLIFETATGEHSQTLSEVVSEYQNTPRKCEMLSGMSEQIVKHATYIHSGWTVNHLSTGQSYRDIFLTGELDDGSTPMSLLLVSIQSQLDYLPKRNVVTTGSQISDYAWENITATVDEVETLLEGNAQIDLSFFDLMNSAGFNNSVSVVQQNIGSIRGAIDNQEVALLETELGRLDGNFKREIPDALEVQLGINFSDGD